jgi:hypothetical protein
LDPLFEQGYQAILVAAGAHQGIRRSTLVAAIGGGIEIPKQLGLVTRRVNGGAVLEADPDTLTTSREGVFASGNVTTGLTSVIDAIGSGKKAAISIDKYLGGAGILKVEEIRIEEPTSRHTFIERMEEKKRPEVPVLSTEKVQQLGEEELGLSEEEAILEGKRCWRCDLEE